MNASNTHRTIRTHIERTATGTLSTRSLSRVLYVLHTVGYNGVLCIGTGRVVTSFPVKDGEVGCSVGDPARQRRLLLSRFAHNDAEFEIIGRCSGPRLGSFEGFGDSRELILEGIVRHTPYSELLWGLGFWSRHFPVPTQHLSTWGASIAHGTVQRVISSFCSGRDTTKRILGGSPHEMLPVLRALYFALQTDLIHMAARPSVGAVEIVYANLRDSSPARYIGRERRAAVRSVSLPQGPSTRPTAPTTGSTRRFSPSERVRT